MILKPDGDCIVIAAGKTVQSAVQIPHNDFRAGRRDYRGGVNGAAGFRRLLPRSGKIVPDPIMSCPEIREEVAACKISG